VKIRGLLVLVIILIVIAPTLSLFETSPPSDYQTLSGNSVIVVAKEDYVYARVLITIQPDFGLGGNPVTLTYPNGTISTVTGARTESIAFPNTEYYTFSSNGAGGPGYVVSSAHPLYVALLTGQNATEFLEDENSDFQGVSVFHVLINGTASFELQELGVSL
jgi:hypothetical protein